ncbi:hypothetical protein Tco_0520684 [Tanacetum coccineum]
MDANVLMIDNDLHESDVPSVSHTPRNTVVNNALNAELATYKEQVELFSEMQTRLMMLSRAKYGLELEAEHSKLKLIMSVKTQWLILNKATAMVPHVRLLYDINRGTQSMGCQLGKQMLLKEKISTQSIFNDNVDHSHAKLNSSAVFTESSTLPAIIIFNKFWDNIRLDSILLEVLSVSTGMRLSVTMMQYLEKVTKDIKGYIAAVKGIKEPDTGKFQSLPEVPGKGKEKVGEEQVHKFSSTFKLQDEELRPGWIRPWYIDEGQAGSDPGTLDEGQAGSNPDDVTESLPLPTPSVLAGPNLEHSDLTVDEQVIPEEPVSSTGTLSSLQHLAKDFSFGQDTLYHPSYDIIPVIDSWSRHDSPNGHWPLPTTTTKTASTIITTTTTKLFHHLPQPLFNKGGEQRSFNKLEECGRIQNDQRAEQTVEKIPPFDHDGNSTPKHVGGEYGQGTCCTSRKSAYEALQGLIHRDECEDFVDDKAQEETKKKGKQDSPKPPLGSPPSPPPPPPPLLGASGASGITSPSDSAQAPPPPPPSSSTPQGDQSPGHLLPQVLKGTIETTADVQALFSDDEVGRDHIPTVNLKQSWWKPLTEDRNGLLQRTAWTITPY